MKPKPKRFIARFWVTYEGKGWIKTLELEAKDIYAAYRTAKRIADSSDYLEFASVDDAPPRKTFREWLSSLFRTKKGKNLMNLRKRLKRKRACWRWMARANCKLFELPFKRFLTWDELPEFYKEHNDLKDVPYIVTHCCPGFVLVLPFLRESDFTPVEGV